MQALLVLSLGQGSWSSLFSTGSFLEAQNPFPSLALGLSYSEISKRVFCACLNPLVSFPRTVPLPGPTSCYLTTRIS